MIPRSTSIPGRRSFPPPSMFKTRRARGSDSSRSTPKPVSYVRDIVCLPNQLPKEGGNITIPRGKTRTQIAEARLFGKIQFSSDMSDPEMRREISCIFAAPMGLSEDDKGQKMFPFQYLQPTGAGSRSLCVPSVSPSFEWNGRQVGSLAKSGGFIYIMAQEDLIGWLATEKVYIYV